ncbi:FtsK/SpoIIIE domain-containing protein [Dorea sp. YH-dor226]|uniref:FtsK/SpoIIIE domain-containing protein n=1 Tax=Dorea sp. YH-dor226 TaxID=3151119 RepID=UPI003242F519
MSETENFNSTSWNGWKDIPAGHGQAVAAVFALREHTDRYRAELVEARNEWEAAKASSQQIYDSDTASARKQCEDERTRFNNECSSNVQTTEGRRNIANTVMNACNNFVNNLPKNGAEKAISAAKGAIPSVESSQGELSRAISDKVRAYQTLRDCQIAEAERVRNDKLDKARTEQIDRDTQAEHRFDAKGKTIREKGQADISGGFNKATVKAYQQEIKSSRFNAESYECPTAVPEYIMLGNIGLMIPNQTQDEMTVVQSLDLQTSDIATRENGQYIVEVPYAQRLSDGISLLMRYSPSDREYVQSLIQPLLLKLFMSFPAGKLEATMIDPLELGASFPDIPKLAEGPNSARIIDTKIWSKEKDIETAIATLRQRLENMTQAYGDDHESRLKKEVIRALAITDFPVGFNDTALKDLHAIVRNSASLGVCVIICANDAELEKLKQKNGNLVAEIAQSVVETKASGNKMMIVGDNRERMFLRIDEMADVFERKGAILTQISSVIEHMQLKIEHFDSMYKEDIYDSNNWFTGNHDEIAIPIGIKGANTIVKMVLGRGGGSTEHHALIAGQTGAGKSTLLHTLIMSTLISYSPDEVQMYLLDFKEGVEFSAYTRYRLPSLRVVAINSEREFGLNVLKELCTELEARTKHFTRYGVSDINGYVKLADVPKVPKLLLIFDEVQELFRNKSESDSISSECLSCLNKLVMQGRAMGIHVILACQDFHNCSGLEAYFSQMAIRIAVKGSEDGAASILSSDNAGIKTLQNQPAGAAIYNGGGGVESANNFFQVSYINEEERLNLLERLDAYYTSPGVSDLFEDQQTRVLLTNAEDNIHNCFNKLILEGADSITHLGKSKDGYGLLLGQGFGKKSAFVPELRCKDRDNLLVVTRDEKMALSMFELSAMSVLYEELHTNADKANALVYIVDLFADELTDEECDFEYLESQFPQQIKLAKIGDAEELITSLYETVVGRSEGRMSSDERIFFMFFGINRARRLRTGRIYDEDRNGELSAIEMLQKIIVNGPKYGVNSIVWGESLKSIELMLGDRYDSMFDKRIAFGLDEDSMDILVAESEAKAIRGKTAVYMDIARDVKNTHFRPYDVPAKVWIERYAETYEEVIGEGGY